MTYTVRHSARAILLTPAHSILLMRMRFPWRADDVWLLPGGGIEKGETAIEAVRREVQEETGATNIEIGPEVWVQDCVVEETTTRMKQRFFLVRTPEYAPQVTPLIGQEALWLQEYRWWPVDDLTVVKPTVHPEKLGPAILQLITHGAPAEPIDVDCL